MSILIKMEMPKNCWKCPMANTYSGYGPLQGCFAVQGKEYACIDEPYDTHYKPSWCPLIEVPKHGRLIDADELMAEYERDEQACDEHGREFSFSFRIGNAYCTEWFPVQQKLMDAPTIIESEE